MRHANISMVKLFWRGVLWNGEDETTEENPAAPIIRGPNGEGALREDLEKTGGDTEKFFEPEANCNYIFIVRNDILFSNTTSSSA